MPKSSASNAYICLRCRAHLHAQSSRIRPLSARNGLNLQTTRNNSVYTSPFISSPETQNFNPRLRKSNEPRNVNDSPKAQLKGWRTLLENKSLGEAASVLVLRDEERKNRDSERKISLSTTGAASAASDVNVDQILSAIEEQKNAPGQEEVNKHIESLRPVNGDLYDNDIVVIPAVQFDQLLNNLSESLNSAQLARYVNIQAAAKILADRAEVQNSIPVSVGSANKYIQRLPWQAQNIQPKDHRGKKALAEMILRTLWHIEVREEIEAVGEMTLRLATRQLLLLMSEGKNSPLHQLALAHNVTIETRRSLNSIKIFANKHKCQRVADEVEILVDSVHEMELDLPLFKQLVEQRDGSFGESKTIQAISERTNSVVVAKGPKLLIRGRTAADAESCRRALLVAAGIPVHPPSKIIHDGYGDDIGAVWAVDAIPTSLQYQHPDIAFGRFCYPADFQRDAVRPKSTRSALQDTTVQSLEEFIYKPDTIAERSSRTWAKALKTHLTASLGHIVHPAAEAIGQTGLHVDDVRSNRSRFIPQTPNLLRLLQEFSQDAVTSADSLSLQLIPSPWSSPFTEGERAVPILDLRLRLDAETQTLSIESLRAIVLEEQIGLMLPHQTIDVQFSKQNSTELVDTIDRSTLDDFVLAIEESTFGHAKVRAPSFIKLKIPVANTQRILNVSAETDGMVELEVDFFLAAIQLVQDVCIKHGDMELVYSRCDAGHAGGKIESLSLKTDLPSTDVNDGKDDELDKSRSGNSASNSDTLNPIDSSEMTDRKGRDEGVAKAFLKAVERLLEFSGSSNKLATHNANEKRTQETILQDQ